MKVSFTIRAALLSDAAVLCEIYNAEVLSSCVNYETTPQTVEQRTRWLENLLSQRYPVGVATLPNENEVVGFAALTPFHSLSGYRFTATGSIYIKSNVRRRGVGRSLLEYLKDEAMKREIHSIIGGVNSQNQASLGLLKSFGFKEAGTFTEIGFKNGQWFDDVCLQLNLKKENP